MKKILFTLLLIAGISIFYSASAQDYKSALGIRLSSNAPVVNNSITFKYFLNQKAALEGLLTIGDPVAIGILYEIHNPINQPGLKWFYGGGGYVGFSGASNLGAMGIIGLDYKFTNIPLNLSLDWKPELNLVSDINLEPAAVGFTARFTFNK